MSDESISLTSFQFSVQVNIDGSTFDYLMTVDDSGQVFEALPMVFELPEIAQKLILKDLEHGLERKIRAYSKLLTYLLPLSLAEQLPSYKQQMAPLVEVIKKHLAEKNLHWEKLPLKSIPKSIAKEVLKVFGRKSTASSSLKARWENLVRIVENTEQASGIDLKYLGSHHPATTADFIPAINPFLKSHVAYEVLEYAKPKTVKRFLLDEFENPVCKRYSNSILYTFSKFPGGHPDIYDAVVRYYQKSDNLSEYDLEKIMYILYHYSRPETRKIGFEILNLNQRKSALAAARTLIKGGVSEEEITKLMLPHFLEADPIISEAAFGVLGEYSSANHLPSAEEVLNIYVEVLSKKNKHSFIVRDSAALAAKTGIFLMTDRLCALLQHELPSVRVGIINLIIFYHRDGYEHFEAFTAPSLIDPYWNLVYDADPHIMSRAITLIGIIGAKLKDANYIDPLLEKIQYVEDSWVRSCAVEAINTILPHIPYPIQIQSVYLSILEDSTFGFRHFAFEGLIYSPDQTLKKVLWEKYKDHSDERMREGAYRLLRTK